MKSRLIVGYANRAILSILMMTSVVGCLGRSPDVRHFVLGASDSFSIPIVSESSERAVLVGPVRLPGYLDRPQMARLEGDGEIVLDEYSRWLGGFAENFIRGISLGLAQELDSNRIVAHPSKAPFALEYQVRFHVDDLILIEEEELRVRIRWSLIPTFEDPEGVPPRVFVMEERVSVKSDAGSEIVRAHNVTLMNLVHRIAAEIAAVEAIR